MKYNPYTRSIQILKDTRSITSAMNELQHELDVVSDALAKVSRQLSIWQLPVLIPKASEHQFGGLWANCGFAWRANCGGIAAKQHSLLPFFKGPLLFENVYPDTPSTHWDILATTYFFLLVTAFGSIIHILYNSLTIPVFIENLLDPMDRSVLSLILFSPVLPE